MRDIFSEQGTVTDVQLKYTKGGVFRQFAFVGYQNEEQAAVATTHFHRSCIQTNRITVEACVALGADAKPKSWSKYATDSSAFQKANNAVASAADAKEAAAAAKDKDAKVKKTGKDADKAKSKDDEKAKKQTKKPNAVEELLAQHKDDPQFVEFMKTHAKGKGIWENDWDTEEKENADGDGKDGGSADDAVDDNDGDEQVAVIEAPTEESEPVKLADQDISDADYMKMLKTKKETPEDKTVASKSKKDIKTSTKGSAAASIKADPSKLADLLTIKIRNIPFKTKRQDVLTFFKPLKPFSVRLPTQVHGICYVGFKTEADFKKAMLKDRSFWSKSRVCPFRSYDIDCN